MPWALAAGVGLLSVCSSGISGLLGAGGGVLLVPMLLYGLPAATGTSLSPHAVTALSLVQGCATAVGGGIGYLRRGDVERTVCMRNAPLLAIGALVGGALSAVVPGRSLLLLFAVVTTSAACLLMLPQRGGRRVAGRASQVVAAVLFAGIGLLGGAIGLGSGFLIIPVLVYVLGTPHRAATGTALVLSLALTFPALAGKASTGQVPWPFALCVVVGALAGSAIGSSINRHLPAPALRSALAVVIALLALRVWIDLL